MSVTVSRTWASPELVMRAMRRRYPIPVTASQGRDETPVDKEVAAGRVGGAVAGQEEHQVGDLGRRREPAGGRLRLLAAYDVAGVGAAGAAHRRRHPGAAEP